MHLHLSAQNNKCNGKNALQRIASNIHSGQIVVSYPKRAVSSGVPAVGIFLLSLNNKFKIANKNLK